MGHLGLGWALPPKKAKRILSCLLLSVVMLLAPIVLSTTSYADEISDAEARLYEALGQNPEDSLDLINDDVDLSLYGDMYADMGVSEENIEGIGTKFPIPSSCPTIKISNEYGSTSVSIPKESTAWLKFTASQDSAIAVGTKESMASSYGTDSTLLIALCNSDGTVIDIWSPKYTSSAVTAGAWLVPKGTYYINVYGISRASYRQLTVAVGCSSLTSSASGMIVEREPNDAFDEASMALSPGSNHGYSGVMTKYSFYYLKEDSNLADADYFKLVVKQPASYNFKFVLGKNILVGIYDSNKNLIKNNGSSVVTGSGNQSKTTRYLNTGVLNPGTYYVLVTAEGNGFKEQYAFNFTETKVNKPTTPSWLFTDTPANAWYVTGGYLKYVVDKGIMTGTKNPNGTFTGKFEPEGSITRGQIATVLYRIANPNSTATTNPNNYGTYTSFVDVKTRYYYTAAIEWCYNNGIVTGYKDPATQALTGRFGPEDPVTREQMATMLYRFAQIRGLNPTPSATSAYNAMPDVGKVQPYARDAMKWCFKRGILTGSIESTGTYLYPQGNATRAQTAKMVTVFTQLSPEKAAALVNLAADEASKTPVAYAVLYADGTLAFQATETPNPTYGEKVEVWKIFDDDPAYTVSAPAPWQAHAAQILAVVCDDVSVSASTAYWFAGLDQCFSIDLGALDVTDVTDMTAMFSGCSNLEFVNMKGWNTQNVSKSDDMFAGCAALNYVEVGEHFTLAASLPTPAGVADADGMWYTANGQSYAPQDIPAGFVGELTATPALDSNNGFEEISDLPFEGALPEVPDVNIQDLNVQDLVVALDGEGVLWMRVQPEEDSTVDERWPVAPVAEWTLKSDVAFERAEDIPWFKNVADVRAVHVFDGVKPLSTAWWFAGMVNSKDFDLQGLDTTACKNMSHMFEGCLEVNSLVLGDCFSIEGDGTTRCELPAVVSIPEEPKEPLEDLGANETEDAPQGGNVNESVDGVQEPSAEQPPVTDENLEVSDSTGGSDSNGLLPGEDASNEEGDSTSSDDGDASFDTSLEEASGIAEGIDVEPSSVSDSAEVVIDGAGSERELTLVPGEDSLDINMAA